MRWPKLQTRVHVEWLDPAAYIGDSVENAKPAACWTEGILVKNEKDYVVLATSLYKDGYGDFTVLVKGCCVKVRKI